MDLIVITGPTASGKTSLTLELAKKYPIEIVSADSRQVFKYLDIGTAKPSREELDNCPHHFINIINPDGYYSAGLFGEQAYLKSQEIYKAGKIPLVVGGSGLYIKALIEGLFQEEVTKELLEIRKDLEAKCHQIGKEYLIQELEKVDPESLEIYSDLNHRRLIRALSYYLLNEKKFSVAQKEFNQSRDVTAHYFAIEHSRDQLYDRINRRTIQMWDDGFEIECKKVLEMGYSPSLNSLDSVGYKECIQYIQGEISKETAIEEMQKFTRRFAKRQLTWVRNQTPDCKWLSPNLEEQIQELEKIIHSL
jgi:tRNA dimethylallyltransferase